MSLFAYWFLEFRPPAFSDYSPFFLIDIYKASVGFSIEYRFLLSFMRQFDDGDDLSRIPCRAM